MKYKCETCDTPLRHHGGPYPPRWCEDHRTAGEHQSHKLRQSDYKRRVKRAAVKTCTGCRAALLHPSVDGLCGFCQVEAGLVEEQALWGMAA